MMKEAECQSRASTGFHVVYPSNAKAAADDGGSLDDDQPPGLHHAWFPLFSRHSASAASSDDLMVAPLHCLHPLLACIQPT